MLPQPVDRGHRDAAHTCVALGVATGFALDVWDAVSTMVVQV
ncbi:MAG: hypothetical protein ABI035_03925 [Gemmatimonadaceae bacterium]